jgi:hypothetical protein
MAEGGFHLEPLTPPSPSAQAGHFGGRPGLVDKHQAFRTLRHPRLAMRVPDMPRTNDVSAIGFAGQQRFF